MKALRRRPASASDDERVALCPALENLSVRYMNYSAECTLELQHSVLIRKAYNAPIKILQIRDVYYLAENDSSYLRDLSRSVQTLFWSRNLYDKNGYKEKLFFKDGKTSTDFVDDEKEVWMTDVRIEH